MDWLDVYAVQGTLKSLLQHQISKASILRCSAFFMVQFSHMDNHSQWGDDKTSGVMPTANGVMTKTSGVMPTANGVMTKTSGVMPTANGVITAANERITTGNRVVVSWLVRSSVETLVLFDCTRSELCLLSHTEASVSRSLSLFMDLECLISS